MNLDTLDDPAKAEAEAPVYPPLETGRVASILRRLVANALQETRIAEADAVDAIRFIDSQ